MDKDYDGMKNNLRTFGIVLSKCVNMLIGLVAISMQGMNWKLVKERRLM